jgi:hypothetical protein
LDALCGRNMRTQCTVDLFTMNLGLESDLWFLSVSP